LIKPLFSTSIFISTNAQTQLIAHRKAKVADEVWANLRFGHRRAELAGQAKATERERFKKSLVERRRVRPQSGRMSVKLLLTFTFEW